MAVLLCVGLALFAVVYWAHIPVLIPWLFVLACPLMHIVMHGGRHAGCRPVHEGAEDASPSEQA